MIWTSGGALVVAIAMILGLLVLVIVRGASAFWPQPLQEIETVSGGTLLGPIVDRETYEPEAFVFEALPEADRKKARADVEATGGTATRILVRVGNRSPSTPTDFVWVPDFTIKEIRTPAWAVVLERTEWGPFHGQPTALQKGDKVVAEGAEASWARFEELHDGLREDWESAQGLAEEALGGVDEEIEAARIALREVELEHGIQSPEYEAADRARVATEKRLRPEREALEKRIQTLRDESGSYSLVLATADGGMASIRLVDIVRGVPVNRLGWFGKLGVYGSRWWEYLTAEPREANSEGGVWPAIFGTLAMTLLMTLLVVPFGVLGALYLREYARQGKIVSMVRIAVNNLASVPSIVFGVFGLGFFCYIMGSRIDSLFFEASLPEPTYGKGGLLWASLTLALLTLPVVVVATEEALSAVPDSMREGSYACGASKWQTIRRIVLPRAMPGVMTGMILAIARGAGEVAPLMLVGAVKMAPELPIDGSAPFVHPERSFMHLGFHIYDLGFQSPNAKAAENLVFTTTLLLIGIVVVLNIAAITIRGRLRAVHAGS
jgi:phosphate transport system permease protein